MQAVTYLIVGLTAGAELAAGFGGALVIVALSVTITVAFGTVGLFAALRTGSGEAVQSLFPVFFVFLFLSSMALPLDLLQTDWFHAVASANPVSYLLQAFRSLLIEGWNLGELALGFGIALAILADRHVRGRGRAEDEAGADVSARRPAGFRTIALAVAWRSIHNFLANPAFLVPAIVFPLFFFVSFAGGLSAIANVPGFDFPSGYTAFQFVFVLLQSAAFGGVFTGFGIARDFETGFAQRYLLAATNRRGIVAGYALAALVRAVITWTVLTASPSSPG